MSRMYSITDSVKVEEAENGTSLVSARIPSYMVADIIETLELLQQIARWLHMRTRSHEAEYLAKRFHGLLSKSYRKR